MFQSGDYELILTLIDRVCSLTAVVCSADVAVEAGDFEAEEEELQLVVVAVVAVATVVVVAAADLAVVVHSAEQEVPAAPVEPSRCSATKPFAFDTG